MTISVKEKPRLRGPCKHCGKRPGRAGRGLCFVCHRDARVLCTYTMLRLVPKVLCKHCGLFRARAQGLCKLCNQDREVRAWHGIVDRLGQHTLEARVMPEPTDAMPGSEDKVAVLEARRAAGQILWHPLDPVANERSTARRGAYPHPVGANRQRFN